MRRQQESCSRRGGASFGQRDTGRQTNLFWRNNGEGRLGADGGALGLVLFALYGSAEGLDKVHGGQRCVRRVRWAVMRVPILFGGGAHAGSKERSGEPAGRAGGQEGRGGGRDDAMQ